LTACWAQERNMADDKVLAELLNEQGLPVEWMDASRSQAVQERYESYTQAAIHAGVFGAPSYVVEGEIFWGQDRLEFVERALAR
jgi:2-hydroxychromene-2-carboxylate isomerase